MQVFVIAHKDTTFTAKYPHIIIFFEKMRMCQNSGLVRFAQKSNKSYQIKQYLIL